MTDLPRIYMDSCCFIDVVKQAVGRLPTDRDSDTWFAKKLLEASRAGELLIFTSILTSGECLSVEKGQSEVPADVQEHFRRLLNNGQYVRLVSPTPATPAIIQDLRWKHGLVLGAVDAVHVASAIEAKCTEFISTDDRLQKAKFKEVVEKMPTLGLFPVKASATGELPDSYRQTTMQIQ